MTMLYTDVIAPVNYNSLSQPVINCIFSQVEGVISPRGQPR